MDYIGCTLKFKASSFSVQSQHLLLVQQSHCGLRKGKNVVTGTWLQDVFFSSYLNEGLQNLRGYACVVVEVLLPRDLEFDVLVLLVGHLKGSEHHSPQHQVEQHPSEDGQEG